MRIYDPLSVQVLKRLIKVAEIDRSSFFYRNPRWEKLYRHRIICVALCQGAAMHYVDGVNGVKDLDVWTFYAEHHGEPFPYRRIGNIILGDASAGPIENDVMPFKDIRVDLIGRAIPYAFGSDPIKTIHSYLEESKTTSAKKLAKKAVVILQPSEYFSRVVWYKGPHNHNQQN